MIFQASTLLGLLATGAMALPTESTSQAAQDLQGMSAAFDKVFTGLNKLNADVVAFTGAGDISKITADNDALIAALEAGAGAVKASKGMSIPDLLNILGPVFVMENQVAETVATMSAHKEKLKAANAPVLDMLTKDRLAADGLVKSITGNLPLQFVTGAVAGPIAGLITGRLDNGIKEWGGTPPAVGSGAAAPAAAPAAASSGGLGGLLGGLLGGAKGTPKGKGTAAPKGSAPPAASAPKAASPPAAAGSAPMAGMAGMDGM